MRYLVASLFTAAAGVIFLLVGVRLAIIDARTHRLPNRLTWPLFFGLCVSLQGAALSSGDTGRFFRALLGAVALAGGYFILHLLNPHGLGRGDVKLALSVGLLTAWLGPHSLLAAAALPFLLAALAGIGLMITRRGTAKTALAFGPWMVAGTVLALALAPG